MIKLDHPSLHGISGTVDGDVEAAVVAAPLSNSVTFERLLSSVSQVDSTWGPDEETDVTYDGSVCGTDEELEVQFDVPSG